MQPEKLVLTNPENFDLGQDSFSYKHLGVSITCQNDEIRCSDFFNDAIKEQNDPSFTRGETGPIGVKSEGEFTYKNKKDSANGTLDFMSVVVDRQGLNMSADNYQIVGDELTYDFNGAELKCSGKHSKCVGFLLPYSYSDGDKKV